MCAHEIGYNKSSAAGNSCHTVHQHVCARQLLSEKCMSSVKVLRDVEGLVINSWQVEILDVCGHCFCKVFASCSSDDCANTMLCMTGLLLWSVAAFCAASMLLMKIAPFPCVGSTMQSMSSSKVPSFLRIAKLLSSINGTRSLLASSHIRKTTLTNISAASSRTLGLSYFLVLQNNAFSLSF